MFQTFDLKNIFEANNDYQTNKLQKLEVSVLHNITLEPLYSQFLKYYCKGLGYNLNINFSGYSNSLIDLLGSNKALINASTDIIIVIINLSIFDDLKNNQVKYYKRFIDDILNQVRERSNGTILWHSFEDYEINYTISTPQKDNESNLIKINNYLKQRLDSTTNAYYVDINNCILRIGAKNFYDYRFLYSNLAPYTLDAISEITFEDMKFMRSNKGKSKKCLIVDCDNVLWGGIVGELGIHGIKIGESLNKCPYQEFQKEIVKLYEKGIFIAVCSKNHESDVLNVFRKNPNMILKEKHLSAYQINWDNKAKNISKISAYLNISLDSIAFIDDSEYETGLVKSMIPEVTTLKFDLKNSHNYKNKIASCGLFESLGLTKEDVLRSNEIKGKINREKLKNEFDNLDQYLQSLQMQLHVRKAKDYDLLRVNQLINKTNQFNTSLTRFNQVAIEQMYHNNNNDLIVVDFKDKFGELGLIGVGILTFNEHQSCIETFLLSCRALGRKIEDVFLQQCIETGLKVNNSILLKYKKSKSNTLAKDFIEKKGFLIKSEDDNTALYEISKPKKNTEVFQLFKSIKIDL